MKRTHVKSSKPRYPITFHILKKVCFHVQKESCYDNLLLETIITVAFLDFLDAANLRSALIQILTLLQIYVLMTWSLLIAAFIYP